MAQRRMFSLSITDSDAFLEMPLSTQALYFHLSMRADDDGFVNNPKRLQKMIGASDDDLKILIAKRFILTFDSGIIVIKHWRMNNYIRNDRYKPTIYQKEYRCLATKENGSYTDQIQDGYQMDTVGIPNGYQMDTQVSIGKDSIELVKSKDSKEIGNMTTTPALTHAREKNSSEMQIVENSVENRDEPLVLIDNAHKAERSYYDWSGYTEEEMSDLAPLYVTYPGIKLTLAELDIIFKCIPNHSVYDDYLFKLQFYRDIKDQFTTLLKWAMALISKMR